MKQIISYLELFLQTVNHDFIHVKAGNGDYFVEQRGNTLYLAFEGSSGAHDWLHNFNFWKKPYKGMKYKWYVHRGFLKTWKGVEDILLPYIMRESVQHIIISGFSQGAAVALLCHEWCVFNRPDLANTDNIEGYGFGQPRVIWGRLPKKVKQRFKNFTFFACKRDIVTHLPPKFFGFRHIGTHIKVGQGFKFGPIKAHLRLSYIKYLEQYEG